MNLTKRWQDKQEIISHYGIRKVSRSNDGYTIANRKQLGMTFRKYFDVITNYGEIEAKTVGPLAWFTSSKDCDKAINLLVSYLYKRDYS